MVNIDLWDKRSLVQFMEWANIRLLREEWLAQASDADLLKMRQELPEEAFVPNDELMDRKFVSLSYPWQSAAHPDPRGLVAKVLQAIIGGGDANSRRRALFWDHKSLFQKKMKSHYNPSSGHAFKDYVIRNRTDEELFLFLRSLKGMHAFYFADYTEGLIIDALPPNARNLTPYSSRGWPLMESTALALSGQVRCFSVGPDGLLESVIGRILGWEEGLNLYYMKQYHKPVPLTEVEFERQLDKRRFTGAGDRDLLRQLYGVGFREYALKASSIELRPNDLVEAQRAAAALDAFTALREVTIYPLGVQARRCVELNERLQALKDAGVKVCSLTPAPSAATLVDSEDSLSITPRSFSVLEACPEA